VTDGPNDKGEMFQRPGRLPTASGHLFAQRRRRARQMWRLASGSFGDGKARPGARTIFIRWLTGYRQTPAGFDLAPACTTTSLPRASDRDAPPLFDGAVPYTDGTKPTVDNYARDVSAFSMWAAEQARSGMSSGRGWSSFSSHFASSCSWRSARCGRACIRRPRIRNKHGPASMP